jgi:hypothetical protein
MDGWMVLILCTYGTSCEVYGTVYSTMIRYEKGESLPSVGVR